MSAVRSSIVYAGLFTAAGLAMPREALAAPPACSSLPNPVYLQVGDTQEPLMKALGKQLRDSQAHPMTLIYKTSGSCTNIDAMYNGTKLTTNPLYVPSTAEDPTWDPSKPSLTCTIDPAGVSLDVANSNVFISACTQAMMPAGIGAFQGPTSLMCSSCPRPPPRRPSPPRRLISSSGSGRRARPSRGSTSRRCSSARRRRARSSRSRPTSASPRPSGRASRSTNRPRSSTRSPPR